MARFILPQRTVAMSDDFEGLGALLDEDAWNWLYRMNPEVADEIEKLVKKGKTPQAISAFVVRRSGVNREDLARRCEGAARHKYAERLGKP
jgi:hypothetical protein